MQNNPKTHNQPLKTHNQPLIYFLKQYKTLKILEWNLSR
jgi:hypothetical protein